MKNKIVSITKKKDFELVLKHGQWFRIDHFSLKLLKNSQIIKLSDKINNLEKDNKRLKIAVSVGLKYSKKAVERNRLRRQVLEVIRNIISEPITSGGGLVIVVPNGAINKKEIISFAEISREINLLFIKAGLSEK